MTCSSASIASAGPGWPASVPLPEHYLLGFDEQKIEAEGIPVRFPPPGQSRAGDRARRRVMRPRGPTNLAAYPSISTASCAIGLVGLLPPHPRCTRCPEGTWLLVLLSLVVLSHASGRRPSWADESSLVAVPLVVLVTMSLVTDINLGLRYVLAILPYVFIATGKVVPWAESLGGRGGRSREPRRRVARPTSRPRPRFTRITWPISTGPRADRTRRRRT